MIAENSVSVTSSTDAEGLASYSLRDEMGREAFSEGLYF